MDKRFFSTPVLVVLLALIYFAAGKLGLTLAFVNPSTTAVWPPTGIALAACLLLGYRVWPGILLGAFLVNVTTLGSIPTSIAIAVGNTLEGLMGAYLVNRFANGRHVFGRAQDIFKFTILAGMVSTTVSATFGVTSLVLNGSAAWADYVPIWLTWWLGDAAGAVIVAPLLILWAMRPSVQWNRTRVWEASLLLLSSIFLGLIVFGGLFPVGAKHYPLEFVILPLVVWSAFRFGQRGAATATLILSGIALWGTLQGFGPFTRDSQNESLLLLQTFMGLIAITGLGLAGVVAERQQAEQALREQREWLQVTLASIGDAVIATDVRGKVTFMNPVAQSLTGWKQAEALERPLTDVFQIINAKTRDTVENPVVRVIREGTIVGLANHTRLIARDGREIPIDDSGAPIKDDAGNMLGVVLIFRDITAREQAEEALRLAHDQLTVILQGAADGIIAMDRTGRLRYANEAAARMIDYPSAEALLEAPPSEIMQKFEIYDEAGQPFPPDRLPGRLVLQGAPQASATIRYQKIATGEEHWSADKSTAVFDADGQVELAVNILHDITDLKHTELSQRLLAEAGRLLSASLDASTRLANVARLAVPVLADWCAVDVIDKDETIQRVAATHVDPAKVAFAHELQRRYPVDIEAPTGVPHVLRTGESEFYPVITDSMLVASAPDAESLRILRELKLRSVMIVPLVARGRTLGALTLVWAESGRHYSQADLAFAEELGRRAGLAVDNARLYDQTQQLNAELEQRINERTTQLRASNAQLQTEAAERQQTQRRLEASQKQLRQLSAHLQATREEERTRIAREIHDELGQALTALRIDLSGLQRSLDSETPAIQEKFMSMSQLIDTTVQSVRRIATELRPGMLDDLGLVAAIEWQLSEFQSRTGIECQLTSNVEESTLGTDGRTALFRIFQETLTNVARHANATSVLARLEEGPDYVTLQVQDNGRGITESDIAKSRSFGLLGIQERVNLLNGELSIHGVPGQGTTIIVRLSLEPVPDIPQNG